MLLERARYNCDYKKSTFFCYASSYQNHINIWLVGFSSFIHPPSSNFRSQFREAELGVHRESTTFTMSSRLSSVEKSAHDSSLLLLSNKFQYQVSRHFTERQHHLLHLTDGNWRKGLWLLHNHHTIKKGNNREIFLICKRAAHSFLVPLLSPAAQEDFTILDVHWNDWQQTQKLLISIKGH